MTVSKRKHISWKTKCAAALLQLRRYTDDGKWEPIIPYDDAKLMTEDQFLSLFHWDHSILHSSEHEDRDKFWNLGPLFITQHRAKTKADAKIIAKSKRIRATSAFLGIQTAVKQEIERIRNEPKREHPLVRRLQSRGFDKTKTKGFDGKVRPRK